MTRVAINAEILLWARERSGLPLETLERRFPKVRQWEEGTCQPTLNQVEDLARTTHTPFGYFFLATPPEEQLPIPHLRTVEDERLQGPSPDLLETVQVMQQRQVWMRDFLIEQGQPALHYMGSARITDNSIDVANNIRNTLGLGSAWAAERPTWSDALRDLQVAIEEAGILVVANGIVGNNTHRKLNVEKFRGFVLADEYAPLIFVNAADGKAAQMFTLAHEIAHVWLGSSAAFDLRELLPANDVTEQACNRIAAELLIPENELRNIWVTAARDDEPYQTVARHFKVSVLVAARRTLDLALIRRTEFLDFYTAYQEDERRRRGQSSSGGDFYATQALRIGRRFAGTVIQAAREGKLLYNEAYKLTGLHGKIFEEFATKLLGKPAA